MGWTGAQCSYGRYAGIKLRTIFFANSNRNSSRWIITIMQTTFQTSWISLECMKAVSSVRKQKRRRNEKREQNYSEKLCGARARLIYTMYKIRHVLNQTNESRIIHLAMRIAHSVWWQYINNNCSFSTTTSSIIIIIIDAAITVLNQSMVIKFQRISINNKKTSAHRNKRVVHAIRHRDTGVH